MLLKVQGYDFTIIYRPGSQMILLDTKSRLPSTDNHQETQLDNRVDALQMIVIDNISIEKKNFSSEKQIKLKMKPLQIPFRMALLKLSTVVGQK